MRSADDIHAILSVPWEVGRPTEIVIEGSRRKGSIVLYRVLGDGRLIIEGDPEQIAEFALALWDKYQAYGGEGGE